MKFAIAALLAISAQATKLNRELPSHLLAPESYNEYSAVEQLKFQDEVKQAKLDSIVYQDVHADEIAKEK